MRAFVLGVLLCSGALSACSREGRSVERAPPEPGEEANDVPGRAAPAPLVAIGQTRPQPVLDELSACPEHMLLVEGRYCPEVRHQCKRYLDPPGRYEFFRCAEYAEPAECASRARKRLRFCVDRDEYAKDARSLPENYQSFTRAREVCESLGKRVCTESEWNFACEGEEMRPYPYGFKRDPTACNADRTDILDGSGKLRDLRAPGDAYPRCVSPFGVRNLAGNLEEFVSMDGTRP
ncbi:MAG TPA: SUMF1/EgtB/PvdO family nonheme iron enzyme, partial [Polyangiaceae bacterium]|nr:SUMF1/EgtB/PvdO family nonheme iron enzyme [Polyangiaceae bacterium]